MPLIGAACVGGDFDESEGDFRDAEFEFGDDVIPPVMGYAVAAKPPGVNLAVDVESTVNGQDFKNDAYACSVPKSMAGIQVGDQVRITRNGQHYALFTVAELRQGDDKVRMGSKARDRLGTKNSFSGSMSRPVPRAGISDEQAEASSEFVERVVDDGNHDGLVIIAPHGGQIEPGVCRQAEVATAALSCSSWICKGFKSGGGAYTRWHITSTKVNPRSFPGLGVVANRGFAYAVSFHGQSADGILIGGAAPKELKEMLKAAIEDTLSSNSIDVTIAKKGDHNAGMSKENVVNWLTAGGLGGIQIEQSMKVRKDHWEEVVEAVVNVYSDLI